MPPADEFLVLDADASQSYAINCAVGGADLVIEGPPGTGKSQTIANLIATLSARGERILFVAEKRAAIDAVLDRLNRVGLADLVLDVHEAPDRSASWPPTWPGPWRSPASIPKPDMTAPQEALVRHRQVLVDRTAALHAPREPWGVSVYEACSPGCSGIPASGGVRAAAAGRCAHRLDGRRSGRPESRAGILHRPGRLGHLRGRPAPGRAPSPPTPSPRRTLPRRLSTPVQTLASHTLPATTARLQRVIADCGLSAPGRPWSTWIAGAQPSQRRRGQPGRLRSRCLRAPLDELAAAWPRERGRRSAGSRARIGNGGYRRARKTALRLWRAAKPKPRSAARGGGCRRRAGCRVAPWRPSTAAGHICRPTWPVPRAHSGSSAPRCRPWPGGLVPTAWPSCRFPSSRPDLQALLADTQTLSKLPELSRLRTALRGAGLWPLVEEIAHRNLTTDQALACLEQVWLSSILDTVSVADPRIGAFDGQAHLRTVAEFRPPTEPTSQHRAARVRRAVAENATRARDAYPRESDVIEHQARLKRGHLPVRQLFQAAPHVLGALRPCWAMSPLVVSQLLPAQRCFDVVIFDEASQVTPADAVGALMRADRAVVAGDPHQLPPTSFFSTSGGGEDDEEAEAEVLGDHGGDAEHGIGPRRHGRPAPAAEGHPDARLALPVQG